MIIILEALSIWFGLSLIVALVAAPSLARRFRENKVWFTAPPSPREQPSVTPQVRMTQQ